MTPFHTEPRFTLYVGNSLDVMPTLPPSSVDSIVSDPPYGLSFMGKEWDHGVPGEAFWREALRVAKPGAHLLAFGGTRTFHRLAVAIEDAGWEIRDCVMWVYGSGFPKSLDVRKAIDKVAGAEREVVGINEAAVRKPKRDTTWTGDVWGDNGATITAPATPEARQWAGWGTALKPAWEPVIVARKPLEGTVAENVLKYGTGGINVDGCRVGTDGGTTKANIRKGETNGERAGMSFGENISFRCDIATINAGRWPANVIHDGSEEVHNLLPESKDGVAVKRNGGGGTGMFGWGKSTIGTPDVGYNGSGSAARFFYCAKASKADRDEGCEGNHHPTVKPTDLMRYLVRLVTPPGGVVLDPFMGSGSTGRGALLEGCRFVGIDLSDEYATIARERIAACVAEPSLYDAVVFNNLERQSTA